MRVKGLDFLHGGTNSIIKLSHELTVLSMEIDISFLLTLI
jgi:hypothetical protein